MPEFVQAMDKVAEYIWGFVSYRFILFQSFTILLQAVDLGVKVMSDQVQKRTGLILNPVNGTNSTVGPNTPSASSSSRRSPQILRPSTSSAS